MNRDKMKKTAYLFDEIGRIDDRLLQEAMQFDCRTANTVKWRKVLLIAATLSLSLVLMLQMVVGLSRRDWFPSLNKGEEPAPETPSEEAPMDGAPTGNGAWTLDGVLNAGTHGNGVEVLASAAEYGFFDGTARLVWQYRGEEQIYVSRSLTSREVDALLKAMTGTKTAVSSNKEQPLWRIWLVCDNGEVRTPYLEDSQGNIGYGDFFDYHAEVIPAEEWISCVSEILG